MMKRVIRFYCNRYCKRNLILQMFIIFFFAALFLSCNNRSTEMTFLHKLNLAIKSCSFDEQNSLEKKKFGTGFIFVSNEVVIDFSHISSFTYQETENCIQYEIILNKNIKEIITKYKNEKTNTNFCVLLNEDVIGIGNTDYLTEENKLLLLYHKP